MLIRQVRIAALAACALATVLPPAHAAPPPPESAPQGQASSSLKDISELSATKPKVDPETLPGAPVYHTTCAACHEGQVPKAPHKMFLQAHDLLTVYLAFACKQVIELTMASQQIADRQSHFLSHERRLGVLEKREGIG